MIGRQIGNFKITKIISNEGGMGVVYLAKNIELNNLVAIKCLKPEFEGSGRQYEEMLLNEGKVQGRLEQHPNILKIKDYIKIDNRGFLIMEYVYGWNLYDIIQHNIIQHKGGLPEKQTLKILTDILQGLDYVHRNAIVHRDIKSANIMVPAHMELKETRLEAKIMDFGIALMMGENQATQYDKTCGTPEYMSKEQILTPHKLDHRTDVYSMGIVLYEMLTGHLPFEGTINEVYDKQINDPPPDMRTFRPDISSELRDIVEIALEKNPDDRFDGCGQFLEEIEKYINGRPSISSPLLESPNPPLPDNRIKTILEGEVDGSETIIDVPPVTPTVTPISVYKIVGLTLITLFVLLIISVVIYFRNDLSAIIRLPSKNGKLHIITDPLNVEIYIDNAYEGIYKGGKPFTKDIEPGKHIISGKRDRYETAEKEIEIASGGAKTINLTLSILDCIPLTTLAIIKQTEISELYSKIQHNTQFVMSNETNKPLQGAVKKIKIKRTNRQKKYNLAADKYFELLRKLANTPAKCVHQETERIRQKHKNEPKYARHLDLFLKHYKEATEKKLNAELWLQEIDTLGWELYGPKK